MGQYYKAIFLEDAEAGSNDTIAGWVESYDYGSGAKLTEHSWIGNEFVEAVESLLVTPRRVVWAGDYADPEPGKLGGTLYSRRGLAPKLTPAPPKDGARYLINHDQRVYVDKSEVKANSAAWTLHPLPVLTAEGNERGGGDLHEDCTIGNFALVGTWARDRISVAEVVPDGFDRLAFDLVETW